MTAEGTVLVKNDLRNNQDQIKSHNTLGKVILAFFLHLLACIIILNMFEAFNFFYGFFLKLFIKCFVAT
jgi:hypothetical protein